MAVASGAAPSPSFPQASPSRSTCSLAPEIDCQASLTCLVFLPSVPQKECPGTDRKGRQGRESGVITAPATSGRVTAFLKVTFQVLELLLPPPPSPLLNPPHSLWPFSRHLSYNVNSSFIKLCLDYPSVFALGPQ